MKVYSECCKQCLLSKNRIVSAARAKEIVVGLKRNQTHFICHKASMRDEEILCKTSFDKFGHYSQLVRIAGRLKAIEFVPQPKEDAGHNNA